MKKLLAAFLLLALLCVSALALAERPLVIDEADLFTADQTAQMEQIIQGIQKKFQIDGVVLTTILPGMSDHALEDYADRYFEDNGYGLGKDRAGFLLMIDLGNRYLHISTAGVMIDYLSEDRRDDCLDAGADYLHQGYYGNGTIQVLNKLRRFLDDGIEEGNFRFDRETGERLSGLYNKLTSMEALFSLLAGAAVTFMVTSGVKRKYALEHSTYSFDKSTQSAVKIDAEQEQFLRESVVRRRTPPPSSGSGGNGGGHHGGSAVHVSSGGMSHGGGGRHF